VPAKLFPNSIDLRQKPWICADQEGFNNTTRVKEVGPVPKKMQKED
jgi:hypothetical protein